MTATSGFVKDIPVTIPRSRQVSNIIVLSSIQGNEFLLVLSITEPYTRIRKKETHELIFSWLSWLVVLFVGPVHMTVTTKS